MDEKAKSEPQQARIVATRPRSVEVDLDWPVEFDGKVWDKITVRRVSGSEVEAFLSEIAETEGKRAVQPPMLDCPTEVYDALDDDDRLNLEDAMLPFLPRRLRLAAPSVFEASENTEKSSEK